MYDLGLTKKAKAKLNPKTGKILVEATERILQHETVEICGSHDLSFIDAAKVYNISKTLSSTLQINPLKIIRANEEVDELYQKLVKEAMDSGNPTQEQLEELRSNPDLLEKFNSIKWLDMLIGFIPYYLHEDFPNCQIKWDEKSGLWQVISLIEVLPGAALTLNHKLAYENKGI